MKKSVLAIPLLIIMLTTTACEKETNPASFASEGYSQNKIYGNNISILKKDEILYRYFGR